MMGKIVLGVENATNTKKMLQLLEKSKYFSIMVLQTFQICSFYAAAMQFFINKVLVVFCFTFPRGREERHLLKSEAGFSGMKKMGN